MLLINEVNDLLIQEGRGFRVFLRDLSEVSVGYYLLGDEQPMPEEIESVILAVGAGLCMSLSVTGRDPEIQALWLGSGDASFCTNSVLRRGFNVACRPRFGANVDSLGHMHLGWGDSSTDSGVGLQEDLLGVGPRFGGFLNAAAAGVGLDLDGRPQPVGGEAPVGMVADRCWCSGCVDVTELLDGVAAELGAPGFGADFQGLPVDIGELGDVDLVEIDGLLYLNGNSDEELMEE